MKNYSYLEIKHPETRSFALAKFILKDNKVKLTELEFVHGNVISLKTYKHALNIAKQELTEKLENATK